LQHDYDNTDDEHEKIKELVKCFYMISHLSSAQIWLWKSHTCLCLCHSWHSFTNRREMQGWMCKYKQNEQSAQDSAANHCI